MRLRTTGEDLDAASEADGPSTCFVWELEVQDNESPVSSIPDPVNRVR